MSNLIVDRFVNITFEESGEEFASITTRDFIYGSLTQWWSVNGSAVENDSYNCASFTDHATGDFSADRTNLLAVANNKSTVTNASTTTAHRYTTESSNRASTTRENVITNDNGGTNQDAPIKVKTNGDMA